MVVSSARKYSPLRNASAKLVPSAEMPNPLNIRRMVTGPNPANRSIRKSRSIEAQCQRSQMMPALRLSALAIDLGGSELHGLAASASADLVRIVENELRGH